MVELQLYGVLAFNRSALDLSRLEEALGSTCRPLVPLLKNLTRSADFGVVADDRVGRGQLEHDVIAGLLDRDARYQQQSESWTDVVLTLKRLAVDGADADTLTTELAAMLDTIDAADRPS